MVNWLDGWMVKWNDLKNFPGIFVAGVSFGVGVFEKKMGL
jgi:hypothetical protein